MLLRFLIEFANAVMLCQMCTFLAFILLNIYVCSALRKVETSTTVQLTYGDMTRFPPVLCRIWPKRVQDRAVCVAPPADWIDEGCFVKDNSKIKASQQVLPHPPFARMTPHRKILRQQRRSCRKPYLEIQNKLNQIKDHPYVGARNILTSAQYLHVTEKVELKC